MGKNQLELAKTALHNSNFSKSHIKCPHCAGDLWMEISNNKDIIIDIYHCSENEHTFFAYNAKFVPEESRDKLYENIKFTDFYTHIYDRYWSLLNCDSADCKWKLTNQFGVITIPKDSSLLHNGYPVEVLESPKTDDVGGFQVDETFGYLKYPISNISVKSGRVDADEIFLNIDLNVDKYFLKKYCLETGTNCKELVLEEIWKMISHKIQ